MKKIQNSEFSPRFTSETGKIFKADLSSTTFSSNTTRKLNKRINLLKNIKSGAGFTLIELIVVFSVIAILSVIGIAAFASYSRTQTLNAGVMDVATMLNLARSRALSQVKPENCEGLLSLNGYEFRVVNNNEYTVSVNCGADQQFITETKQLPKGVTFSDSSLNRSVFFYIISGGVNNSLIITINESGNPKKDIVIDSIGSISVKNHVE